MSTTELTSTVPVITIRPRMPEDLAAAAKVMVDVHETDGYPVEGVSDAESWLTPPEALAAWVAFLSDALVGHVLVMSPSPHADSARSWLSQGRPIEEVVVLARLFVHKNARGQGVGKLLTQAVTEWASRDGKRVLLDVLAKDQAAIRLYERLGWKRIDTAIHDNGRGHQFETSIYISPRTSFD